MLFGKLLPREGNFFELFNQHGDFIVSGARSFILLIQNYADLALREKYANDVGTAERGADRITAEVNRLLHKTFIAPIDHEQTHGLVGGLCAEAGGAITLVLATALGVPVSTTHTITAAIGGDGSVQCASAVRGGVAGTIVCAWVVAIPASAFVAGVFYWIGLVVLP